MSFDSLVSQDWAQFVYLAILLLIVSGQIFRREKITKEAMKYFASWLLIILFSVVLYSYRFEFSDFKNRFIGELFPSRAVFDNNNNLIVKVAKDGHFYIDLSINHKVVRFMIDTGASDIVIDTDLAGNIGLDTKELVFTRQYQTANGIVYGASIFLDEIEISGLKFYNVSASVANSKIGSPLLGMSFLRRFKKYEFYHDQLILTI